MSGTAATSLARCCQAGAAFFSRSSEGYRGRGAKMRMARATDRAIAFPPSGMKSSGIVPVSLEESGRSGTSRHIQRGIQRARLVAALPDTGAGIGGDVSGILHNWSIIAETPLDPRPASYLSSQRQGQEGRAHPCARQSPSYPGIGQTWTVYVCPPVGPQIQMRQS